MSFQQDALKQLIHQRLAWLARALVLTFLVLVARLWQLQIIQGPEYAEKADRNRVRSLQLVAPRGTIADRNNIPLVENRPGYNILLYRESVKDMKTTSGFIVDHLAVRAEDLVVRLRRNRGGGSYRPVVIKEDVGIDDISVVEAHRREHPEIQLGPEPRRLYRYRNLAAHVLGYVGEVSEDDITREVFRGAKAGDLVGKAGVERTYNTWLTGIDGKRQVMVDSLGREVGSLDEEESIIGGEVQLTLDLDLQFTAERLLKDHVGAIVAMDPRNGEILAMASAPSFDPNNFSARISEADWSLLLGDPNKPFQNRAIQNAYPPGSIFKLVMTAAGLEEGFLDNSSHIYCNGAATFYNRVFHCSEHKGHGYVSLQSAIVNSCDIFFYDLGKRLGIDNIANYAEKLGLGGRAGIDLPGEKSGLVPSPEWKQRVYGVKWYAGETISVAIGQGQLQVTPLQLVRAVSAIATGNLTTPHLLLKAEKQTSSIPALSPATPVSIDQDVLQRIREGMWGVVNSGGTGRGTLIAGMDICGKTGTVQVVSNEKRKELNLSGAEFKDHSWFVAFASRDNPEIAVVVFVEHGGWGASTAVPMAREMFKTYFVKQHKLPPDDPSVRQISEGFR